MRARVCVCVCVCVCVRVCVRACVSVCVLQAARLGCQCAPRRRAARPPRLAHLDAFLDSSATLALAS